jgi:hypothetical protein
MGGAILRMRGAGDAERAHSEHGEHDAPATVPAERAMVRRSFTGKATLVESTPRCDLEVMAAELETLGFSADEAARLARFRVHAQAHGEYAERKAIERRLEFVLWLVEHGRLKH